MTKEARPLGTLLEVVVEDSLATISDHPVLLRVGSAIPVSLEAHSSSLNFY